MSQKIRHPKKRAFLAAYSETGNVSKSAQIAEIDRSLHYEWVRSDEKYAEAFEQARGKAADALEAEARRRAVEGVAEPVFYKGEVVGEIQKYSDPLLMFLMKGADPEKYRERQEVRHSGGMAFRHEFAEMSDEELQQIIDES